MNRLIFAAHRDGGTRIAALLCTDSVSVRIRLKTLRTRLNRAGGYPPVPTIWNCIPSLFKSGTDKRSPAFEI